MRILVFIGLVLVLILISCKKDKDTGTTLTPDQERMQQAVVDLQKTSFDKWEQWNSSLDSLAAMDSLQKIIEQSPDVEWASRSIQGIMIQYKSGIRGGIFLNPRREMSNSPAIMGLRKTETTTIPLKSTGIMNRTPAEPRTAILCPPYNQFSLDVDGLVEAVDGYYKRIDLWEPELYYAGNASVEKFTFLENYGVVDIYTHGAAWPDEDHIDEVYILTGETVNDFTSSRYWKYINTGDIPLIFGFSNNYYFLSPEFIVKYNNFEKDSTLIYGGFCFSGLGSWHTKILAAKAGGYFCYDWSVISDTSDMWEKDILDHLTDKRYGAPLTCGDWFSVTPLNTSYFDESQGKLVSIKYYGDRDLALWEPENTYNYFSFLWQINGYFSNDPSTAVNFGGNVKSGPGVIINNVFMSTDIEDQVYSATGEIVIERNGELFAYFNPETTGIDSIILDLHERSIYYPDLDMEMKIINIPRITYDESIPASVYQLGGTSACGHIVRLTYKTGENVLETYECPNEWSDVIKLSLTKL